MNVIIVKFSSILIKTSENCFYIVSAFELAVLSYRPFFFDDSKAS